MSLSIGGVTVGDIELLLMEELTASERLRGWFFEKCRMEGGFKLIETQRPESGLGVRVKCHAGSGSLVALLIVVALESASSVSERKPTSQAIQVLVAPRRFLISQIGIRGVALEDISDWFICAASFMGARAVLKAALAAAATRCGDSGEWRHDHA